MGQIIQRTMPTDQMELRIDGEGEAKIVGHAAVFDSPSEPIFGQFIEVIKPGAFDRALSEKQDVRALFNHEANIVLGRTVSGTLRLFTDSKGLGIEIDPPDTNGANDVKELIRRGDVSHMSFAFIVKSETFIDGGGPDGLDLREINDLDLFDVSPVTFPAYLGTDVELNNNDPSVLAYEAWQLCLLERIQLKRDRRVHGLVRRQRQAEVELTG